MDQIKIGQFISELRKEKDYTQRQLADLLGISDKTVSKWECGNGMPDLSIMPKLCEVLGININELLSGKRLVAEDYNESAESNMLTLMKEKEETRKKSKKTWVSSLMGEILLLFVVAAVVFISGGHGKFVESFMDLPTLLFIVVIDMMVLLIVGNFKAFLHSFTYCFKTDDTVSPAAVKQSYVALVTVICTTLLTGILITVVGVIMILRSTIQPETLGMNLSVSCIAIFYSALIALCLIPFAMKLKLAVE